MMTFVIWAYGSWYIARETQKGWYLLWVVPALATIAAILSGGVHVYMSDGSFTGEAILSGMVNLIYGLIGGSLIAAVTFWRRRRREKRDEMERNRIPNNAPLVNPEAFKQ